MKNMTLENVVQGHGEIVLRGEINETINSSINYLNKMQNAVVSGLMAGMSREEMVRTYNIESCGKSRIALNGLVQQLHAANLLITYDRLSADKVKLATLKAKVTTAARQADKAKGKVKAAKKPKAATKEKPAKSTAASKKAVKK